MKYPISESPLGIAIVALVERERAGVRELLFVRRAAHATYPGYWNGVTGGLEPEDDDSLCNALRREVAEEAGLNVRILGKLWESTTAGAHFVLHWFAARCVGSTIPKLLDEEINDARWMSIEDFRTSGLKTFEDSRRFLQEIYPLARERLDKRLTERKGRVE